MKEQYFFAASMKLVNSLVAIILDTSIFSGSDNVFSIAVIEIMVAIEMSNNPVVILSNAHSYISFKNQVNIRARIVNIPCRSL